MTPDERIGVLQSLLDRVTATVSERGLTLPQRVPRAAWTRDGGAPPAAAGPGPVPPAPPTRVGPPAPPPTVPGEVDPRALEELVTRQHDMLADVDDAPESPRGLANSLDPHEAHAPPLLAFPDAGPQAPPLQVMSEPLPAMPSIGHGPEPWGGQDSPLVAATRLAAESSAFGYSPGRTYGASDQRPFGTLNSPREPEPAPELPRPPLIDFSPRPDDAPEPPAFVERAGKYASFEDEDTASANPLEIEAIVLEEARLAQAELDREIAASGLLDDGEEDDGGPRTLPPTSVMDAPLATPSPPPPPPLPPRPAYVVQPPPLQPPPLQVTPAAQPVRAPSLRPSAYPLELEDLDDLSSSGSQPAARDEDAAAPPTLPPAPAPAPRLPSFAGAADPPTEDIAAASTRDEPPAPEAGGSLAADAQRDDDAPPDSEGTEVRSRPRLVLEPSTLGLGGPPSSSGDVLLVDEREVQFLSEADEAPEAEPSLQPESARPSTEPPPTEHTAGAFSIEEAALAEAALATSGAQPAESGGPAAEEPPASSRRPVDLAQPVDDGLEDVEDAPKSGQVESQRYPVGVAAGVVVDRPETGAVSVAAFEGVRGTEDLSFGELLDAALSLG